MMRAMNVLFHDYITEGWLKIYIDDFLICAENSAILEERTKKILERATQGDILFKMEKCDFDKDKIEFWRMIISENLIQMDPTKLRGIENR
jgi:hypothetical protein